ncbi:ATP-utilizing chromatin assembly and remodelling N-terminal-domain-containing protein [Pilobolus umbonatus]|nr:ATP-utilizing chromatin assembly and remodelling N-terminal-domain-containing protein [Pilobolus umbonatus]
MPLLKRKRFSLVPTPDYDPNKKESANSLVWYLSLTREIFSDYSLYLKRIALYKKPIWQCESTGKSNLTYSEALESERLEKERLQDKLPVELQKQILLHVQFLTARLETVVDNTFHYFSNRFVNGELLHCIWDDGIAYNAIIVDTATKPDDADDENELYYKVQLTDENSEGIDGFTKVLPSSKLKRKPTAFSKVLIKKFIKEYMTKDTYIGAPWVVNDYAAARFNIDTSLPRLLQDAKEIAYSKSRRRRRALKENNMLVNGTPEHSINGEKETEMDIKKLEATIKYPIEDLNLPIYRLPPVTRVDTEEQSTETKRPRPSKNTTVPPECFGSFLMVWSFLGVFAKPLKLSPFSLDDFESALHHNAHSTLLMESNVALLNAIISQRNRLKKESQGHGSTAIAAAISLYGSGYESARLTLSKPLPENGLVTHGYHSEDETEEGHIWRIRPPVKRRAQLVSRGCGSVEIEEIGHDWDMGTIESVEEREGWEDILIGFMNQLATIDTLDEVDRLLNQLVPYSGCTLDDREKAYVGLSLKDKIKIFEMLINVANESFIIKNYMEECQEQMTELRKQKIELSRERKRIQNERRELDDKQSENNNQDSDPSPSDDDLNATDNENDEDDSALLKAQRKVEKLTRHESRLVVLKRKQAEKEEREAKRLKLHHLQREEARVRNQELKQRNELRKRLDEDERIMHKKEEQVERDLRKFNIHRIRPLGRDKFYNRYYYLDDIGGTLLHGSGRLFVQCPSDTDLMSIQERDLIKSMDTNATLPCRRGEGVKFVADLMRAQDMSDEATYVEERLDALYNKDETRNNKEWWQFYDEPEQINLMLDWLNPKGIREFRLKRELEKHQAMVVNGMKKHIADQQASHRQEETRRSTRNRTVQVSHGPWMSYVNKYA